MKTEYLLNREVDLILAALTEKNRLVIRTALVTGLRITDVLELKPERLKPHFWVTEKKTGKKRQVGLPEPLLTDLKKYAGKYWVFPGRKQENHHTRQAVWKDVKRALNHSSETVTMIYALADMQLAAKYKRKRSAKGRKVS